MAVRLQQGTKEGPDRGQGGVQPQRGATWVPHYQPAARGEGVCGAAYMYVYVCVYVNVYVCVCTCVCTYVGIGVDLLRAGGGL